MALKPVLQHDYECHLRLPPPLEVPTRKSRHRTDEGPLFSAPPHPIKLLAHDMWAISSNLGLVWRMASSAAATAARSVASYRVGGCSVGPTPELGLAAWHTLGKGRWKGEERGAAWAHVQ